MLGVHARKRRSGALTNQGFIPPLGESKRSSYRSTVSRDLNPYEPPPAKPLVSLLWDRSVLTQLGFGIHVLVLIVYMLITIASDRSASSILAEIDTRFHIAMATCTAVGFAMVFMITITTTDWPLHQRWWLIAIDLLFIGLITFVAHGFGLRGW